MGSLRHRTHIRFHLAEKHIPIAGRKVRNLLYNGAANYDAVGRFGYHSRLTGAAYSKSDRNRFGGYLAKTLKVLNQKVREPLSCAGNPQHRDVVYKSRG